MRNAWDHARIADVCEIVNGGTPKTSVPEYWNGKYAWITPAEMGKRPTPYANDTTRKLSDSGLQDSSATLLPPDSVILSSRAPIGHLVINQVPMATNQGCKGLVPGTRLEHKFLYYFLLANIELLQSLGTGTTFKELSAGKLKEVVIPVPPLGEQRRIVAILDKAFAAIATAKANTEKNLQNARALAERTVQGVFQSPAHQWNERPLGELAQFRNGLNYTKNSKGEQVRIVGVKDFQDNFSVPTDGLETVTIDGQLDETDRLRSGDLLTVRSNGNPALIGRCMVANGIPANVSHSGFTIRIRVAERDLVPEYLCRYLRLDASRRQLTASGTGVNIKSLNQQGLSRLLVRFPSAREQRLIVAKIESILEKTQAFEDLNNRKLAALDELKKSLLHEAFNGRL